jgi:hypothetical protein
MATPIDFLDEKGLTIADFDTRLTDLLGQIHADISPIYDGSADSSEGQFIRIVTERIQSLAELVQAVHSAQYPDGAIGFSLAALARLTGTQKRPATESEVECRVNIDAGTHAIGALVAHVSGDPTARFANAVAVTNAGPGAADVDDVLFKAETAGPVAALSGTLTVIAAPVTGWNSVTNAPPGGSGDAIEGLDTETDAELRQRRAQELQTGSTATGAILTALTQTTGVVWAAVLENDTDLVDANGLPPHSIEAVVHAPTLSDAELAPIVYNAKASGIKANGDAFTQVKDTSGHYQSIGITRATILDTYLEIDVNVNAESYAGDDALKAAVVAWGDSTLGVGDDVVLWQVGQAAGVEGVEDVTAIRIGLAAPPTSTVNLAVDWNEIADLDTSRITVTATPTS